MEQNKLKTNKDVKFIQVSFQFKNKENKKITFEKNYKAVSYLNTINEEVKFIQINIHYTDNEIRTATFDKLLKAVSWLNLNDISEKK